MKTIYLHTDGACRKQSIYDSKGVSSYGYVVSNDLEQSQILTKGYDFLGEMTNNEAEWYGLLEGLKACVQFKPDLIEVRMDSKLVVFQASGVWGFKKLHLYDIFKKLHYLIESNGLKVNYEHIRREKNALADSLANRALDE